MQNESHEAFKGTKFLHILISILVAAGIWFYADITQGYDSTVTVENIPVEFFGENSTLADRGLMLLDDTERTLSLKVTGSKLILMQLDTSKIRARADLSDIITTGVQSVNCRILWPSTKFNSSNLTTEASSYSVLIHVGELYRKSVEVRCDIQGNVADGYIAGKVQLQPSVLELRGQESDVEKVSYAKVTLQIDDAKETINQSLSYQLYDESGNEIESANVHPVTDQVQVVLPVSIIKELPLVINFLESPGSRLSNVNYTIDPPSITVSGDATLLKNVESIVLDDGFDLSALSGTGEATSYYQITLPDGCENLSGVTRATLKISYKDLTTATVSSGNIEYENAPEGKTVTVLTSELPITLRGTSGDVAGVTAEDITIAANLQDVSSASGSYTVPVEIRVDTEGDVGVVGTYQIRITISEEEPPGGEEDDTNSDR